MSVGPFGGSGGLFWDDKPHNGIKKITLMCGDSMDSMRVEYVDNETSSWSTRHGGWGGRQTYTFSLDYPHEYLISFSGSYGDVISSLSFESNKRKFGPFGNESHTKFFSSYGLKIVGFHGYSGTLLDALGAHLESIVLTPVRSIKAEGGPGGSAWDDGPDFAAVRKVEIWHGGAIDSIRFEYDDNGNPIWSSTHGGGDRKNRVDTIELAYPHEYLVSVSGSIEETYLPMIINSLTLVSNTSTYGPIGPRGGKKFTLSAEGEKIVGFHGRSGLKLDAIGIYTVPIPKAITSSIPVESVGPSGGEGVETWDLSTSQSI